VELLVVEASRLVEQAGEMVTGMESLREGPLVEAASLLLEQAGEEAEAASLLEGSLALEALRLLEQGVEVVSEIASTLEKPLAGGALELEVPLAWMREEMTPLHQAPWVQVVERMAVQEASFVRWLGLVKGPMPTVPRGVRANE